MSTRMRSAVGTLVAFMLVAGTFVTTAAARDSGVDSLYGVEAKIIEVLQKRGMRGTKHVRERFEGKTSAQIERFARQNRVDERQFLLAVYMCQVIAIEPVQPVHAFLLVNAPCNIAGLPALRTSTAPFLRRCMTDGGQRRRDQIAIPTEEALGGWITAARTAGESVEQGEWATEVQLAAFRRHHQATRAALERAGWTTNLLIHENLSVSGQRDRFASRRRLPPEEVNRYAGVADLLRLAEMNTNLAELFYQAGVVSLVNLKGARADELVRALAAANARHRVVRVDPDIELVSKLIELAKPYSQH